METRKFFFFAAMSAILLLLFRKGYLTLYKKYYNMVGPDGFPFIGCIISYLTNLHFAKQLGQKYSSRALCHFNVLGQHFVCINDSNLARILFKRKELMYRAPPVSKASTFPIVTADDNKTVSTGFANGRNWQRRRRYLQVGISKYLTTPYISRFMQIACEQTLYPHLMQIMQSDNKWYPAEMAQYLAFNTIYFACFDQSLPFDSDIYRDLISILDRFATEIFQKQALLDMFTVLNYMPFFVDPYKQYRSKKNKLFFDLIHNAKQRLSMNERKCDTFMSYTLSQMECNAISMNEAILDVFLMFAAGTNTTKRAIEFAVTLIAKHVDIQDKVRKELLSVMSDKKYDYKLVNKCPLFRAMVYEILRVSSVARFNLPHQNPYQDVDIMYHGERVYIHRHSNVLLNIDYVQRYSEKEFEHGEYDGGDEMHLENWLSVNSETGKVQFVKHDSFCLFGYGRRDCVGKTIAMKELNFTVAWLLMHFELRLEHKHNDAEIPRAAENFFISTIDPPIPIQLSLLK